jgi:predicted nucleic acid-binding protein
MAICVLDSAMALAWFLPGEGSAETELVLQQVVTAGARVPGLWPLEVANVLLMAERRQRLTQAQRVRALTALGSLSIAIDTETATHAWTQTISLAAAHGLTVYDAAYLELALRMGLPLATLDEPLARASRASGVAVLGLA